MRLRSAAVPIAVLIVMASPLFVRNEGYTLFLTVVLIWGVFGFSFNLAFGTAGMLSFGHAAFFGVGAYTLAIVGQWTGWPFSLLLCTAVVVGLLHGLLVGLMGMRSDGVYFGLFTLAMAEFVNVLLSTRLRSWTGGADGISGLAQPDLAWTGVPEDMAFYLMCAMIFSAVLLLLGQLRRSAFGRVLNAGRLNAVRVGQIGFDIRRYRVVAFALSAGGSALAGALLGSRMLYASPELLNWSLSGDVLLVAVIGGSGSLLGPAVGALLVETLKSFLGDATIFWSGWLGAVFIVVAIFLPRGLVGQLAGVMGSDGARHPPEQPSDPTPVPSILKSAP